LLKILKLEKPGTCRKRDQKQGPTAAWNTVALGYVRLSEFPQFGIAGHIPSPALLYFKYSIAPQV
jgi:hypothetical protein